VIDMAHDHDYRGTGNESRVCFGRFWHDFWHGIEAKLSRLLLRDTK
jgi:hypothetical protein